MQDVKDICEMRCSTFLKITPPEAFWGHKDHLRGFNLRATNLRDLKYILRDLKGNFRELFVSWSYVSGTKKKLAGFN